MGGGGVGGGAHELTPTQVMSMYMHPGYRSPMATGWSKSLPVSGRDVGQGQPLVSAVGRGGGEGLGMQGWGKTHFYIPL